MVYIILEHGFMSIEVSFDPAHIPFVCRKEISILEHYQLQFGSCLGVLVIIFPQDQPLEIVNNVF